ncbi:protease SohB [Oceanimonas baumannii]|uniref:Protease SohB n=1 Tax=Oceanimonas baumannii TaxID=129578 RepID=A0A235CEQ0_9GAMM|nr:protease SohB [Oceanimonas baumannii]OYD23088.1 protease SohB [Oceanimonas baumannii]TDW58357.1 serine protease SohB [Oceanimonas baumannii]
MEFLYEYGLFAAKVVTWVAAVAVVIALIVAARQKQEDDGLKVKDISAALRRQARRLRLATAVNEAERKTLKQDFKQADKAEKKQGDHRDRLYVIDFKGSMDAHEVSWLSREVTALLQLADPGDEVLVRVESGGGVVHGYGLGAAELQRLKGHGLKLTVAVDKVAASGGYMMACVAEQIIAAPFAIVGSVGVVAQMPNFNKFLKNRDIDIELHTAGEYKRTLTLFGENSEQGRAKFREELEVIHQRFKHFIAENRPKLELDKVATGEHWLASDALALGLVDTLQTSSDYLLAQSNSKRIISLSFKPRQSLKDKLGKAAEAGVSRGLMKLYEAGQRPFG